MVVKNSLRTAECTFCAKSEAVQFLDKPLIVPLLCPCPAGIPSLSGHDGLKISASLCTKKVLIIDALLMCITLSHYFNAELEVKLVQPGQQGGIGLVHGIGLALDAQLNMAAKLGMIDTR